MSKINRWLYSEVIQGDYGYGWEDLYPGTPQEVTENFRKYRLAEPAIPHRVIFRRDLNPDWRPS